MKLQILIQQYKETDDILKPMLDSIELQQNVNFSDLGVIIVNDGSDVHLSKDFLDSYSYKIEYFFEKHRGVSATRNACLDHATAEYVMFCDADDMFFNMCGIWMIFREIDTGVFDSLVSVFVEETRDPVTKTPVYINREMDSTFVHGKVHRRQYLIDKGIRWNEKLTIHEDSYFNIQTANLSTNVKYCQSPFYLWKWRDDSVCRHDPKYILKTYNNMIDSNDALIESFRVKGFSEKAAFYVIFMIFDAYYTMNKPEWINQENQEYRNQTEKRFAKYYKKYKDVWNSIPHQDKMRISQGIRGRSINEGMLMESQTVNEWLEHISSMKEE
jgi:glycosyltransferase involved in cell wall biosynthesis